MARPPRRIANNPNTMRQQIEDSLGYNPALIKQIMRSYRGELDPGAEAQLAQGTVYAVWREFLAAYVEQSEGIPEDEETRSTFADFGDLHQDFGQWWTATGRDLFKERGEIPVVTVADLDGQWGGDDDYPKHITLRIPLTVPKALILQQINAVMKRCHMGPLLYRHRHSTARRKLHARPKYLSGDLRRMLRVWKLTVEHRNNCPENERKPWWWIGHEAQLAPALDPYADHPARSMEEARAHLASLASDLYAKADTVMAHGIRGSFPNAGDE